MGPKFGAQKGNKLGSQLGPMSITKLSLNWACQMGPIHCPKFFLPGFLLLSLFEVSPLSLLGLYVPSNSVVWFLLSLTGIFLLLPVLTPHLISSPSYAIPSFQRLPI